MQPNACSSAGCWRRDRWNDEKWARLRSAAPAFHAGTSVFRPAPVNGLGLSCNGAAGRMLQLLRTTAGPVLDYAFLGARATGGAQAQPSAARRAR